MRVIAGSARRIPLKTPDGLTTRPTQDRIKETLFNMIQYQLADCVFLDLFAGSGAIGLETLSRGADTAVFVEQDAGGGQVVRENLRATRLEERAAVMHCDALTALKRLEGKYRFDYIFMDPPYSHGLERQMLAYLEASDLIDRQSTISLEAARGAGCSWLEERG